MTHLTDLVSHCVLKTRVARVIKSQFAIALLMMLALGLPLALPAEDVPETAFDESEAAPYEGTPLFSIVLPPVAARTTQRVLSCLHLKPGAPSLFAGSGLRDTDANRPADARASLTLLCTLLC